MNAPMVGSWVVRVHEVRPFSIHGDEYYELHVTRYEDTSRLMALRVAKHAIDAQPETGQSLEITFLMGQVTGAKRISGPSTG
jgi:hypothetical protein